MGFILAQISVKGSALVETFTELALEDTRLRGFSKRVEMIFDPEVEDAYPKRWIGPVEVETTGRTRITSRVDVPKGDPGNILSGEEIEGKMRSLASSVNAASDNEVSRIRVRALEHEPDLRDSFSRSIG